MADSAQSKCLSAQNPVFPVALSGSAAQVEIPNCFQNIGVNENVIIALDRSATVGSIANSRSWVEKIEIAIANDLDSQHAARFSGRLGLVLFSSSESCLPYEGGSIEVSGAFPCLYVEPKSISDESHRRLLKELLIQAKGKFSKTNVGADFVAPLTSMESTMLGAGKPSGPTSLLLFTDGLINQRKDAQDVYASLKLDAYARGRARTVEKLQDPKLNKIRVAIHLPASSPSAPIVSDGDALDTMCALDKEHPVECGLEANRANPETWPVNKMNILELWKAELAAKGSTDAVQIEASKNGAGESVWIDLFKPMKIESFSASESGHQLVTSIQDGRWLVSGVPQKDQVRIELSASLEGDEKVLIQQPFSFRPEKELVGQESFARCNKVDGPGSGSPAVKLGNFQGGGHKCGVVDASEKANSILGLLFVLLPLAFPLMLTTLRQRPKMKTGLARLSFFVVAILFLDRQSLGAESVSKQNLQTFAPVNQGVGLTDEAGGTAGPSFSLGIFADQSTDPFVRKSSDGEKLSGSVNSISTAHLTGNWRLLERVQAQFHLPYHRQDPVKSDAGEDDGIEGNEQSSTNGAAGNGSVAVKLDFWKSETFSAAAKGTATVPLSKGQSFAADDSSSAGGSFLMTLRTGPMSHSIELGRMKRSKSHEWIESDTPYQIDGYDFGQLGSTWEVTSLVVLGTAVSGRRYLVEQSDEKRFTPLEWTAGITWHASSAWDVSAGGGAGIGEGLGSPSSRMYAGIVLKVGGESSAMPGSMGNGKVVASSSPGAVGTSIPPVSPAPNRPPVASPPQKATENVVKTVVWRRPADHKVAARTTKLQKSKAGKSQPKKKSTKMPQTSPR